MTINSFSRRGFLGASTLGGAIALASSRLQGAEPGPNEKINVALIGCNGMGRGNLDNLPHTRRSPL